MTKNNAAAAFCDLKHVLPGLGSHSRQEGPLAGLWTDVSTWHFPDDQTCLFPINTHNNTHKQAILKARIYRLSLSLCCKQSFPSSIYGLNQAGHQELLWAPQNPQSSCHGDIICEMSPGLPTGSQQGCDLLYAILGLNVGCPQDMWVFINISEGSQRTNTGAGLVLQV